MREQNYKRQNAYKNKSALLVDDLVLASFGFINISIIIESAFHSYLECWVKHRSFMALKIDGKINGY